MLTIDINCGDCGKRLMRTQLPESFFMYRLVDEMKDRVVVLDLVKEPVVEKMRSEGKAHVCAKT